MKRRHFFGATAALAMAASLGTAAMAQDKTYVIGVSIPSATHGFMGGLNWHAQQTIDACEAGKDVYCEKPLTHDMAAGERLAKRVRDEKRPAAVNFSFASSPSFQAVGAAAVLCVVERGQAGVATHLLLGLGVAWRVLRRRGALVSEDDSPIEEPRR